MTNPKTLARTNGPQTSKDAAKRMVDSGALNRQEEMVYGAVLGYIKNRKTKPDICNPDDFTTKDIAVWMCNNSYHKDYEICRKRFSGLFDKFKIVLTGDRREGCRVWELL